MNINDAFLKIDSYDMSDIKKYLNNMNDSIWIKDTFRQDVYTTHQETSNIILIWQGFVDDFNPKLKVLYEHNNEIIDLLENTFIKLEEYIDGTIVRAIITKLPANKEIKYHLYDGIHKSIVYSHRIHIPIVTNDDIEFMIDGNIIQFKENIAYEINNMVPHYVKNKSNFDRIHLILDIIEKKDYDKF